MRQCSWWVAPVAMAWTTCAVMLICPSSPHAQAVDKTIGVPTNQTNPPLAVPAILPPTQAIDAPPVVHLLGDWGGIRPGLESRGINLQFDALTEFAGNVSGGVRQASSFASQIGLQADMNWERLAGLTGVSTHVILVSRSGSSVSHIFGDNLLPAQEIYGSGGDVPCISSPPTPRRRCSTSASTSPPGG